MRVTLPGCVFELEGLAPAMDNAFANFYRVFFGNSQHDLADLEREAFTFFDSFGKSQKHDAFFNNFTPLWRLYLQNGQLERAESIWKVALRPALAWENQHQGRFVHKGTPFYFWGMTAVLKGDLDKGYALMHQALEEDVRTFESEFQDAPAFAFVTLDYTKIDQAFRDWVLAQAKVLQNLLTVYSQCYGKQLTLEQFRNRFLCNPPGADAVFLFAYALARLMRLDSVPNIVLQSDFASQLEINLLFDVTLVIGAAIHHKNPDAKQWQFIDQAVFLSNQANLELVKSQLGQVNERFQRNFDLTLAALLDGTLTLENGSALSTGARDLAISYGLRNRGAHNVSSARTVCSRFADVRQSLFNTLFLCVEALY